jgi:hypothetical protein
MRVEVARQAGVCYYTPDLLEAKCTELSYSDFETLSKVERKSIRDLVKQEYLAHLFINNMDIGSGKSTKWYSKIPYGNEASPGLSEAEKRGLAPQDIVLLSYLLKICVLRCRC